MSRLVSVVLILVVLLVSFGAPLGNPNQSVVSAQGGFTFEISPASPVNKGSILSFRVVASEGTTRINVDGNTFFELGAPAANATYDTNNLSVGWHTFCAQIRTNGGWENAASQCQDYEILANNGGNNSGGINFYDYCRHLGYDRDGHDDNNAYTWRCVDGNRETGLNMYDVCDWQYGGSLPFPGLSDHRDPYSWSCNSTQTDIDPIDPPQPPDNNDDDDNGGGGGNGGGNNGGGNNGGGGNSGGGNSGDSIPFTNAKVGDRVEVINSPSNDPLLCKQNHSKGKDDVISRLTNGDTMTITDGPWEDQGLYFVKVSGDCNGYVATGVNGQAWIQKKSGSSGGNNGGGNNGGGSNGGGGNSGDSIPYTNARVGDTVVVVNSPSDDALLCKTSAKRGTDNVKSRVSNGDVMTITDGPWLDDGLYFVKVSGDCNGYVATGQSGQSWIEKTSSSSGGGSDDESDNSECKQGWQPSSSDEVAGWVWVDAPSFRIQLQDLSMYEQSYLSLLASTLWWEEISKDLGTDAAADFFENLLDKAGVVLNRGMNTLNVVNLLFNGHAETWRFRYGFYRSVKENLEFYDNSEYRCGNYVHVRTADWDIPIPSNTEYPFWWATFSSYLPFSAWKTCADYPDTCGELFD